MDCLTIVGTSGGVTTGGARNARGGSPGKGGGAGLGPTDLLWAFGAIGSSACGSSAAFKFSGEDFTVCGIGGCNGRKKDCGADALADGAGAAGLLGEGATGGGEATELGFGLALASGSGLGFGQDDDALLGLYEAGIDLEGRGEADRGVSTTEVA